MRVLWFEVTVPQNYSKHGFHGAGWQDALESIVNDFKDIELGIAFESRDCSNKMQIINEVHYFPLCPHYNCIEKLKSKTSWELSRNKLIPLSINVIEEFKPDVIHVFGSEWCFGQVTEFTDIPVVVHMQGSIPSYNNAFYPPSYNEWDEFIYSFTHFKWKNLFELPMAIKKQRTWKEQEEYTLSIVKNFMGRTEWDKAIVKLHKPDANYFHCNEALRPYFINTELEWSPTTNQKLILTTIGCSSLWKGLDTIVRTARLLEEHKVNFEWCLVGNICYKELIEWKEKILIDDINIRLLGMLDSEKLVNQLLCTDIYVHTAYIDNSPNSICEAQYLGLPIIATYVGGIPSLIENGLEGVLVPANDPYILTNEIMSLAIDRERQIKYSKNSRKRAIMRHNPKIILKDLLNIYNNLLSN